MNADHFLELWDVSDAMQEQFRKERLYFAGNVNGLIIIGIPRVKSTSPPVTITVLLIRRSPPYFTQCLIMNIMILISDTLYHGMWPIRR
jgi:hypothetical protein